jgi:hypothetical protein
MPEDRGQMSEVRSQMTDVGGQKSDAGSWKTDGKRPADETSIGPLPSFFCILISVLCPLTSERKYGYATGH